MRTYGRRKQPDGSLKWVTVETTRDGNDDLIWIITLAQTLKLFLNESPFFANYGIPAKQSVLTQVFPDFYVSRTQQQFAQYFASLIVYKKQLPSPEYVINITTNSGEKIGMSMDVPQ